jgi:RimJ/RimL family protein N-acetyltransferase
VLTRFAFDALDANRVHLRVDPRNTRSRAIPDRLGYVYEGRLRNDSGSVRGEARDTDVFALVPDEFRRLSWAALA